MRAQRKVPLAACVLGVAILLPATALAVPAGGTLDEVMGLLHDGRFDAAEARIGEPGGSLDEASRDFLRAFATYWRLLYDPESDALQGVFERRLEAAFASSAKRIEEAPRDTGALLWSGTAHLLLAELRAKQDRPFAAAREAKRARRALRTALDIDPGLHDARFGLGTLDVLAARLPTLAKGLGSLLGLGGDRERGIAELERAAERGRLFAIEARVLLLSLHASRHERAFGAALDQAEHLLSLSPTPLSATDGAARVLISLGFSRRALDRIEAALALAEQGESVAPALRASLRLGAARAHFSRFRPDLALAALARIAPTASGVPGRTARDALELAEDAAAIAGEPPWLESWRVALGKPAASRAGGSPAPTAAPSWRAALPALANSAQPRESTEILARLAAGAPGDPVLALLAGQALLAEGRPDRARDLLGQARSSLPSLPPFWRGPCLLLAAQAEDLGGNRTLAVALYGEALDAPPFVERNAAFLYRTRPYTGDR